MRIAPALRWAGIDAVNVANNHAFDFGAAGQAQTLAALRRAQVQWTGRPGQVTIVEVNGVNVALLGFAGANRWGVLVFVALLALASYGVFWVIMQQRKYE